MKSGRLVLACLSVFSAIGFSPSVALAADRWLSPVPWNGINTQCGGSGPEAVSTGAKLVIADYSYTTDVTLCPERTQRLGRTLTTQPGNRVYVWFRFQGDLEFAEGFNPKDPAARFAACVHDTQDFPEYCKKLKIRNDQLQPAVKTEAENAAFHLFDWRFRLAIDAHLPGTYEIHVKFKDREVCPLGGPCPITFTVSEAEAASGV